MTGFLTRVAALVSISLSVVLMLMFGWQGATCIDEWTMAACNLAIGATLMLGGSGAFSLDNAVLACKPTLAERGWFRWMSGASPLPMQSGTFQKVALTVFAATIVFNVATYNYYRGSVITPFHGGPVSSRKHHLDLTDGVLLPNGAVRFHAYLDGGTPEAPSNVMTAVLKPNDGSVLEQWDGGMSLAMLLHFIQHIAFDYSVDAVISQESFLQGVSASSPMRRVLMLATWGLVAGVGGQAVYRIGRPLGATLAGWLSYRAGLPPEVGPGSRSPVAQARVSPPSTTSRLAGRSLSLRSCWGRSVCLPSLPLSRHPS